MCLPLQGSDHVCVTETRADKENVNEDGKRVTWDDGCLKPP